MLSAARISPIEYISSSLSFACLSVESRISACQAKSEAVDTRGRAPIALDLLSMAGVAGLLVFSH